MYHSKEQIQLIEQRSIAIFNPSEGPHSLPVKVDRSCFQKTEAERANLQAMQNQFKRNGLSEWNKRNRPGNNRTSTKHIE